MAENLQEPEYQFIEKDEQKEFEAYFEKNGLEGIADYVSSKISEVENVPVKIAVTGMAGTGKSTFINTFRGLTAEDNGAADAAVVESEATKFPEEYHHPRNENITLWDLPGIGTSIFNKGNYVEKVNFDSYDFFLIFIGNRFLENDEWLAKRAQLRRKKYFIVRTHIDNDIENDRRSHRRTHDASRLLTVIREETKKLLERGGVYPEDGVYLISTFLEHVDQWDYRKLEHDMLNVLPKEKSKVLTLSLSNISENLIKAKCDILRSRVWRKAIFLAAQGFAPPGLGRVMPQKVIDYINKEMTSYREALGLDEESLERLSQRTGVELKSLISLTSEKTKLPFGKLTIGTLMSVLASRPPVIHGVPVLTMLATLVFTYRDAYKSASNLLHEILDRLEKASLQVLKAVVRESSGPEIVG